MAWTKASSHSSTEFFVKIKRSVKPENYAQFCVDYGIKGTSRTELRSFLATKLSWSSGAEKAAGAAAGGTGVAGSGGDALASTLQALFGRNQQGEEAVNSLGMEVTKRLVEKARLKGVAFTDSEIADMAKEEDRLQKLREEDSVDG